MNGREAVDVFHRSTQHGERVTHPERLLAFQPLDPTNRPEPFKTYRGVEPRPLPRQLRRSARPAVDVLSGRGVELPGSRSEGSAGDSSWSGGGSSGGGPLDEGLLGTLLFLAGGVTRVAYATDGEPIWFRPAMSAGNLRPIEIYVVGEGAHHYDPLHHALVPLRSGGAVGEGVTLVLTGIPFRTCWKYGERGWRHLWWDAGTLLANLLAAAEAHGVPAHVATAFPDAAAAALVGVDGVDEMPLAVVRLGPGEPRLPDPDELEPVAAEADPVARHVLRFPLVVEAQAATALPDDEAAATWLRAAQGAPSQPPGADRSAGDRGAEGESPSPDAPPPVPREVEPPDGGNPDDRIEDVILRRGSTRVFRPQTAATPLLRWGMAAAGRAVPLDAAGGGTLLEHLVNVHDVAGMDPGRHRYVAGEWEEPTPSDDARAASTHLCLDQPLGGDSAYTVFHAAALGPLLARLGGRGYRAAHLEAGIVAGRLALCAVALGGGATGLTFYDGRVARYFGSEASPLLATAVGIPATVPAPSGTPGAPAELGGYGRIMTRLTARLQRRPGR